MDAWEQQGANGTQVGAGGADGEKWRDLNLSFLSIPTLTFLPEIMISTQVSTTTSLIAFIASSFAPSDPFAVNKMLLNCKHHHIMLCSEPIHDTIALKIKSHLLHRASPHKTL